MAACSESADANQKHLWVGESDSKTEYSRHDIPLSLTQKAIRRCSVLGIKIVNGTVIDGTGRPAVRVDVGICGDKIVDVGDLSEATSAETIDASGCLVTPGFVDIHSHSDGFLMDSPGLYSKLRQGVTTEITGTCGHSAAPYDPSWAEGGSIAPKERPWRDVSSFFSYLETVGIGGNVVMLAGHGALRLSVIGPAAVKASASDLEKMADLLRVCLDQGCAGLSSGLIYPPGIFADEAELTHLASVLPAGRMYATHMRNEASLLFDGLAEAFKVAEKSGSRLEISHLKACGKDAWGRIPDVLELIEAKERAGVDVSFDAYPYSATHTGLRQLFPPWTQDGGRPAFVARLKHKSTRQRIVAEITSGEKSWENLMESAGPENITIASSKTGTFDGQRLSDIAVEMHLTPVEAACEVALVEDGEASIITFEMQEDDVRQVLSHRLCSICSDGSGLTEQYRGHPHPRNFGAFARFLSKYLLQERLVPIEEGVRRMTSFPASRTGIPMRGVLTPGYFADVLVIDPKRVSAPADFAAPKKYATGFKTVVVNGVIAVKEDAVTGVRAGRVIRF